MTPGARVAAAIEILDQIRGGAAAEQALTAWARRCRFAGSKDRAAVRDHVFDVLRARRSLGDGDGRALMIALALREGWDVPALFSGDGHAPSPLVAGEDALPVVNGPAACDIPDWLWPEWEKSLGSQAAAVAQMQQRRAGVFLRVNQRRASREDAQAMLAEEGIGAVLHPDIKTALEVTENQRKVRQSSAYLDGLVELQDPSSQAAVARVPVPTAARILDYCAGGGGKALAFADLHDCTVSAHDISSERMTDIPNRAARAGVQIDLLGGSAVVKNAPFDVVFCDAPCSGSGTWRRAPDAKWRLTQDDLTSLTRMQDQVIAEGGKLTTTSGVLAYATCSVLDVENEVVVARFLSKNPEWQQMETWKQQPSDGGDGFFLSLLCRRLST